MGERIARKEGMADTVSGRVDSSMRKLGEEEERNRAVWGRARWAFRGVSDSQVDCTPGPNCMDGAWIEAYYGVHGNTTVGVLFNSESVRTADCCGFTTLAI